MFIVKFSFVWDKICEVFDGILMYIFHESYNVGFWDSKVGKFIECSCIAPLTQVVIVISELVF